MVHQSNESGEICKAGGRGSRGKRESPQSQNGDEGVEKPGFAKWYQPRRSGRSSAAPLPGRFRVFYGIPIGGGEYPMGKPYKMSVLCRFCETLERTVRLSP